jgi:hypothetical protein
VGWVERDRLGGWERVLMAQKLLHFRYCPYSDIPAMMAKGWMVVGPCPGHHGYYSALIVWLCGCDPA